jgi:Protein of unknown function (DUF3040)
MSLAPGEEAVLAEVESRLRRSDPRLAAKLALFGYRSGRGPSGEALSPWRGRRRQIARKVILFSMVIAVVVIGTALAMRATRGDRSATVACRQGRSSTRLWWPGFCRPLTCPKGQPGISDPQYPPADIGQASCRQTTLIPDGSTSGP